MELEELKNQWNRLSVRVERLEEENRRLARELATGRAISSQTKLVRRLHQHAICGLILPVLSPFLITVLKMPLWVAICYAVFGIICMFIDLWLARTVKNNNLSTQTVMTSLRNMLRFKRNQRRIQCVLIVVCFTFLAFAFFPYLAPEQHMFIGGLIGLVLGLIFGILEYRKKTRLINDIITELKGGQSFE